MGWRIFALLTVVCLVQPNPAWYLVKTKDKNPGGEGLVQEPGSDYMDEDDGHIHDKDDGHGHGNKYHTWGKYAGYDPEANGYLTNYNAYKNKIPVNSPRNDVEEGDDYAVDPMLEDVGHDGNKADEYGNENDMTVIENAESSMDEYEKSIEVDENGLENTENSIEANEKMDVDDVNIMSEDENSISSEDEDSMSSEDAEDSEDEQTFSSTRRTAIDLQGNLLYLD